MIYHIFYLPKLQNGDSNNRIKKKATSESPIPPATTPDEGSIRADSTTPPPPILEPEMNLTEPEMTEMRLIPRLVDTDGQTAVPRVGTRDENLNPGSWTCDEVAQFLEINEIKCDPLVEAIIEQVSFFLSLKF